MADSSWALGSADTGCMDKIAPEQKLAGQIHMPTFSFIIDQKLTHFFKECSAFSGTSERFGMDQIHKLAFPYIIDRKWTHYFKKVRKVFPYFWDFLTSKIFENIENPKSPKKKRKWWKNEKIEKSKNFQNFQKISIQKSLYLRDYWELVGQPVHRYDSVQPSGTAGHVSGTWRSVWRLL